MEVSEEEVREAIMSFVGPYDQIPPMYSALKVNGQKLCDLARAGKEVERKARPVEIYEIQIEEIYLPRVRMTVSCSKGTYIRTLCHDIGEKLKCHGCMESLLRTRVGQFQLKDSLTLAQVEIYRDEDVYKRQLLFRALKLQKFHPKLSSIEVSVVIKKVCLYPFLLRGSYRWLVPDIGD